MSKRAKLEARDRRRAKNANGGKGLRSTCPHCGQTHYGPGHFVGPGFGIPGLWTCDPLAAPPEPAVELLRDIFTAPEHR